MNDSRPSPLVKMTGISKRFGAVAVLRDVDLEIRAGEVHILAGENGAGKSTLIKILGGVHRDFDGTIEMQGQPARLRSTLHANQLGISIIFQELSLVPAMSVVENIFLGQPICRMGFVQNELQRRRVRQLLAAFDLNIDIDSSVERLPIAQQQMVEIIKALSRDAKVIVMDEPTSALAAPDVEKLFSLIATLKKRGCGIVYITHKMEEIERIADRITVLRDGRLIGSAAASDLPMVKLIHWMVGRELGEQFPRHLPEGGDERLRVENFSVYPGLSGNRAAVDNISFAVKRGEILGVAGLQGSGASELLLGIFGAYGRRGIRGNIRVDGRHFFPSGPRQSRDAGVALLTNDRKATGLVLSMSVTANMTLAALHRISPGGWRSSKLENQTTRRYAADLSIKSASFDIDVSALSGGNQQKVAIAKWLAINPRVLLLDEPTRGIDIGAKRDIYELMNQWTAQGIPILMITSELPELLAMSDRIIVLHRGKLTAEFTRAEATPDKILSAAMGAGLHIQGSDERN